MIATDFNDDFYNAVLCPGIIEFHSGYTATLPYFSRTVGMRVIN